MIIWSTRGRTWGHRFLRDGGTADPLVEHDRAFAGAGEGAETFHRRGATIALRFADPEGREDAAGRPIYHEIVTDDGGEDAVTSLEGGIAKYWPLLADDYGQVWDQDAPLSIFP